MVTMHAITLFAVVFSGKSKISEQLSPHDVKQEFGERPRTPEYDCFTMNRHWRTFGRAALALVLVASLTFVLVHWHRDSRGQDCGLCSVQHMPTLQTPTGNIFVIPANRERTDFIHEIVPTYSGFIPVLPGRAPPQAFVSI
jgi:hypothetical protein